MTNAYLSDAIFWATTFWQEQLPKENPKDLPVWALPEEGAQAISEAFTALGHEVSPADVHHIYQTRL